MRTIVLGADAVVGGQVDAGADRLGRRERGQDARRHAVDGHEVQLRGAVGRETWWR